jgi:hypothetical protein
VLERRFDRERRDVGLGEIARAGPGIDALGGKLSDSFRHADCIPIAGNDLGARVTEGEGDGISDLAGAPHSGDEYDLAAKVELVSAHVIRLSRTMSEPGAPAWV